jgi:hypothetical protein
MIGHHAHHSFLRAGSRSSACHSSSRRTALAHLLALLVVLRRRHLAVAKLVVQLDETLDLGPVFVDAEVVGPELLVLVDLALALGVTAALEVHVDEVPRRVEALVEPVELEAERDLLAVDPAERDAELVLVGDRLDEAGVPCPVRREVLAEHVEVARVERVGVAVERRLQRVVVGRAVLDLLDDLVDRGAVEGRVGPALRRLSVRLQSDPGVPPHPVGEAPGALVIGE